MDTKPESADDDSWERIWNARLAAMEAILGPAGPNVYHAAIPLQLGGPADVVPFPNYLPGHTYVTADLTGDDNG